MDRIAPFDKLGVTPIPDWQNADPASGNEGSIPNADFFNVIQAELLAIIDAAQLTRDATNRAQVLAAIRALAKAGIISKRGLGQDGSGNLGLDYTNLTSGPGFASPDTLAYRRASDGALFGGTVGQLVSLATSGAASPNPNNTQISSASIAGLSLAGGSQSISNGQGATVIWNTNVIPSTVGTYSNGRLTVTKPGWYEAVLNLVITASSTHSSDSLSVLTQVIVTPASGSPAGGNNDDRGKAFQPSGTNNAGSVSLVPLVNTGPLYFGMNDVLSVMVTAGNQYGDATNITLQPTTNMKFVFLNP